MAEILGKFEEEIDMLSMKPPLGHLKDQSKSNGLCCIQRMSCLIMNRGYEHADRLACSVARIREISDIAIAGCFPL